MKGKLLIGGAILAAIALMVLGRNLGGTSATSGSGVGNRHGGLPSQVRAIDQTGSARASASVANAQEAPDFTLQTLAGEDITLSEFRGNKPVVLDFFATWCPNCQRDMPRLSRMYERYKDRVEVIGVNLQERQNLVEQFRGRYGISFPIVMDPFRAATNAYGVRYTNFHVLVDIDGNIAGIVPGDISESDIRGLIGET